MFRRILIWSVVWIPLFATFANAQGISADCAPAQKELQATELATMLNDLPTAVDGYKLALQAAPSCVEAMVNLGVLYNRLNQPDEAVKVFQQALTFGEDIVGI